MKERGQRNGPLVYAGSFYGKKYNELNCPEGTKYLVLSLDRSAGYNPDDAIDVIKEVAGNFQQNSILIAVGIAPMHDYSGALTRINELTGLKPIFLKRKGSVSSHLHELQSLLS